MSMINKINKLKSDIFSIIDGKTILSCQETNELSNILLRTGLATRVSLLLHEGMTKEQIAESLHQYIDSYKPGIAVMHAEYRSKTNAS